MGFAAKVSIGLVLNKYHVMVLDKYYICNVW